MYVEFGNAFDSAIRATGFTQEKLAELCGISVGSVSNYCRGISLPGDDIMLQLIEHCKAPWLGWIWLRSNRVGATILPEVPVRQLSESCLDFQVEMNHVAAVQMDIAEICRDNRVDEQERPRWEHHKTQMLDIARSVFSVLLRTTQKEKAPR